MKRTDGLVQCRCKEWRTLDEICSDGSCIYCEDIESEEKEPTDDDLLEDELALDFDSIADAYMVDDDDEFEHDW